MYQHDEDIWNLGHSLGSEQDGGNGWLFDETHGSIPFWSCPLQTLCFPCTWLLVLVYLDLVSYPHALELYPKQLHVEHKYFLHRIRPPGLSSRYLRSRLSNGQRYPAEKTMRVGIPMTGSKICELAFGYYFE